MTRYTSAFLFSFVALATCAQQPVTLHSMGDTAMEPTLRAWEQAFHAQHPEIEFRDNMLGSATGMAGIITGVSEMTVLGRPVTANEVIGFEWVHRVKPLGIQVARGSLLTEEHSPALAVLVSGRNPLTNVTTKQLAAILGCPTDASKQVTWADAGATGSWTARPIHVYLYDNQTGTGAFLNQALQPNRDCWNWSIVHEFKDTPGHTASQQITQALEHDPDGIAIATLGVATRGMKVLTLNPLNATTVSNGTYPLARSVYIYVNLKTKPMDASLAAFLSFVLSPKAQRIVAATGDFLPLDAETATKERGRLQ